MAVISMLFVFSVMGLRFAELRILAPLFRDGDNSQAAGLASSIFNLRIFAGLVAASGLWFWLHLSNSVDDRYCLWRSFCLGSDKILDGSSQESIAAIEADILVYSDRSD